MISIQEQAQAIAEKLREATDEGNTPRVYMLLGEYDALQTDDCELADWRDLLAQ